MKLFFDARYIRPDSPDGLSRYSSELARALIKITPVTFLISDESQKSLLPKEAEFIKIHKPTSFKEPFSGLILNKLKPDVVFSPLQSMGGWGRKFKLILTQQDTTYYKINTPPSFLPPIVKLGWKLYHLTYLPGRIALNSADIVATVSKTSAKEILAARLTKRPIIIVPNSAENFSKDTPINKIKYQKNKNLIYMGAFLPHKNVETLIKMMEFLPDKTLHLLSKISPDRQSELEKIQPKNSNIIFHNGVSDEQYKKLLLDNSVMVFASKSEGFGLPLIEALSLGVPAVVSDMEIFREVGGNGALFANPDSPEDFAQKIKKLDNFQLKQELHEKGIIQAQKFSWDKSAKELYEACKNLLK